MKNRRNGGLAGAAARLVVLVVLFAASLLSHAGPAHAAGTTWRVTTSADAATGDLATHRGSLRFALNHAQSGDLVSFDEFDTGSSIFIASTLVVPAGVTVGWTRDQPCGTYTAPLVNIKDPTKTVNPLVLLQAGATLRNVNLGGGDIGMKIAGADVDVCGVGLGLEYDQIILPLPPKHAALIIDGPGAVVHRSYLNGAVAVTTNGSDSRIGDAPGQTGEGNAGIRACSVTILADTSAAARRVTIRDPFPRALSGIQDRGVPGGDDAPNHANNWAETPVIASAVATSDGATVQVRGDASPRSLVDIYFDTQTTIVRAAPVAADSAGQFQYTGPLPAGTVGVFAVSTLNDPQHPGRVGSSSQWSAVVPVMTGGPAVPQLSATGALANLSRPGEAQAAPGDRLRLTVTISNTGTASLTNINSTAFNTSSSLAVVAGSGAMHGQGAGFTATDGGFSGGLLAAGRVAAYTLDLDLSPNARAPGSAIVSLEVNADGVVSIPVVARIRIDGQTGPAITPRVWLPIAR